MKFAINNYSADDFIFLPGCVYDGNRFKKVEKPYPPILTPQEAGVEIETITTTNIFGLNKDGSGRIEINTGNLSVPCIGAFSRTRKNAILVFTVQEIDGTNLRIAYENGEFEISLPGRAGDIPCKVLEFDCADIHVFYRAFFENRKIMGLDSSRPPEPDWKEIWRIHEDKFNHMNWQEHCGFYSVGVLEGKDDNSLHNYHIYQTWQPGWVGGALVTYALLKLGSEESKLRAVKTLEFLFKTQTKAGFFRGIADDCGNTYGDGHFTEGTDNYHLIRKSADVLYFLFKHFDYMPKVPERFLAGTRKLADAFVSLWERYGQLGQFVNDETGEIIIGNSASGGIAPAGLVSGYQFFNDSRYLRAAEEIAEYYYNNFTEKGYSTGGPGETLQCPDSESAFGLLESFVELYDVTGNEKYLKMAKEQAHQCSSWVVAYNYKFPETSQFCRLGMKSIGSVIANAQNKHSAPGICMLSGYSLMKLYQWTKDELYKELIDDISKTIWQYMSTDKRPIYAKRERRAMPQGFINERVNLSDWEGYDYIGEIFYGSCWCEATNMLTIADFSREFKI